KNRGVEDILIACVDGLSGFPDAIESVFPKTNSKMNFLRPQTETQKL
ncbi:mutator family transposase, partial [Hallerella porci]